jgi:hypothetical protein
MFLQFLLPFFVEFSSKSCISGKIFLAFWKHGTCGDCIAFDFDCCLSTNIDSVHDIHGFMFNLEVFLAYSIHNG